MPDTLSRPQHRHRPGRRRSHRSQAVFQIRHPRPTLLDHRLRGDAWVLPQSDQTSGVYFGNYCLTNISATSFDLPTFNRLLDIIRIHACR
jgi:hypothetical protein